MCWRWVCSLFGDGPSQKGIYVFRCLRLVRQYRSHWRYYFHGIAIAELIGALLRRDSRGGMVEGEAWRGLRNTGWTGLLVTLHVSIISLRPGQIPKTVA